ncbi:MAG: hypothetical protein VX278_12220, partial [Myxococcota bacterium]|nr:hypothetical protein [Myxococcota bacterium]
MSRDTNKYIIGFAGAVCIFWSVLVSGTALSLKEQQNENKKLDLKKNVVAVSGLVPCEDGTTEKEDSEKYKDCKKKKLSATEVNEMFTKSDGDRIKTEYIELKSGKKLDPSEKDWEAEIKKDLKACKKLDKAKNKPQI